MTILGNNPANRLIEVVAGTTSLISDSAGVQSHGPLAPLAGSDTVSVPDDHAATVDQPDNPVNLLLSQALPLDGGIAQSTEAASPISALDVQHLTGLLDLNPITDGGVPNLAGDGATLQPVFDTVNEAVLETHFEMEVASYIVGLPGAVHAITNTGETIGLGRIGDPPTVEGHTNLVTDALNLPGEVLQGHLADTISQLSSDLGDTLQSVFSLKDTLLFVDGDATNPVPELLASVGHDLQSLPILDIGNGNNGGLLDGVVGHLVDSSSHHLIDVDVGPAGPDGLPLNVLASPQAGDSHTLEVNAIDVAPGGPVLADLGVLTGGQLLDLPGGSGADALVGNLLGAVGGGAPADLLAATGSADSGADLPAVDVAHGLLGGLTDHGLLNGTHVI